MQKWRGCFGSFKATSYRRMRVAHQSQKKIQRHFATSLGCFE